MSSNKTKIGEIYRECLNLLQIKSSIQPDQKPTKSTKGEIRRSICKIKDILAKQKNAWLYSTGSLPGKFYTTAIQHKLKNGTFGNDFPLNPVISNVVNHINCLTF